MPITNYSTAIFLVRDDVRCMMVSYDVDAEGKGVRPFVPFKTFDTGMKVGDRVLIPTDTRHRMTVARVEEVDVEVDIGSSAQMQWLIDTVDDTAYKAVLAQERDGIDQIKAAERRSQQRELREKLLADNPDLQALAKIATDAPALPAPAPEQ